MGVDAFISRWSGREGGAERANYALFLTELTAALDLPPPEPADSASGYRFEYPVRGNAGQPLRIDLYKQGCFILEAKQSRLTADKGEAIIVQEDLFGDAGPARAHRHGRRKWDADMRAAFNQAWDYANRLPPDHERPAFLITCDVGRTFEFYSDFTGQGRAYRAFPGERDRIIALEDLADPGVQDRFRAIWNEPASLDPAKRRAEATREVAAYLAQVSKALEERRHPPEEVATFLTRTLFAMFAEDVGLLPADSFKGLLQRCQESPDTFAPQASDLFRRMDEGGFSPGLNAMVRRFNGAFYKDRRAFPLKGEEIGALLAAAGKDWRDVEPAIFGTLLEQALDGEGPIAPGRPLYAPALCGAAGPGHGDGSAARRLGRRAGGGGGQAVERRRARGATGAAGLPRPADHHAGARPGLRHRQLPLCDPRADEGAGKRGAGGARRAGRRRGRGPDHRRRQARRRSAPVLWPGAEPARRGDRRAGAVDRLSAGELPPRPATTARATRCWPTTARSIRS